MTAPDNMKSDDTDQSLTNKIVKLQFFSRRVPHRMECRVIGRFRLLPEIVERLDFSAKSAYKLVPTKRIAKQEKRQYFRYTQQNFGDGSIPLTSHVTFDVYAKSTNRAFAQEGAPAALLKDLQPAPHAEPAQRGTFTTRDSISAFRDLMLLKEPQARFINVTKVRRDQSTGMVKKPDEELLLGDVNILGLDLESVRDVLYLKKSGKSDGGYGGSPRGRRAATGARSAIRSKLPL